MGIVVAEGEVGGNGLTWHNDFAVIGEVCRGLGCLEAAQAYKEVDWDLIFDGAPSLSFLSSLEYWPPFYNPKDFDSVHGFWTLDPNEGEGDDDEEDDDGYGPGNSYEQITIILDGDGAKRILKEFQIVWSNLRAYEPVKPFL